MMPAFPQLASGAMAQMPLQRAIRFRSRSNVARDGSVVRLGDQDFEERTWHLAFRDLTDAEWQALEDLFAASEGRLGVFTFLEPICCAGRKSCSSRHGLFRGRRPMDNRTRWGARAGAG
jgi:hypothetical protein